MKRILGSASPRRKSLFKLLHIDFEVKSSAVEEPDHAGENPGDYAEKLARMKAFQIAKTESNAVIIGADTIVVLGTDILGKPKDALEAESMLNRLSGKTHQVITAVCLIRTDISNTISKEHSFHVKTDVTFSSISQDDIRAYIQSGSPFDKAGSYGIQDDRGALFVEHISGDYYTVVGFPLNRFYYEMKLFEPDFFLSSSDNQIHS